MKHELDRVIEAARAIMRSGGRGVMVTLRGDRGAQNVLNEHRDQLAVVPLARAED
jgi:hypothetical protein